LTCSKAWQPLALLYIRQMSQVNFCYDFVMMTTVNVALASLLGLVVA